MHFCPDWSWRPRDTSSSTEGVVKAATACCCCCLNCFEQVLRYLNSGWQMMQMLATFLKFEHFTRVTQKQIRKVCRCTVCVCICQSLSLEFSNAQVLYYFVFLSLQAHMWWLPWTPTTIARVQIGEGPLCWVTSSSSCLPTWSSNVKLRICVHVLVLLEWSSLFRSLDESVDFIDVTVRSNKTCWPVCDLVSKGLYMRWRHVSACFVAGL